MDLHKLASALESAEEGYRKLDQSLGLLMGYQSHMIERDGALPTKVWYGPNSEVPTQLPPFTSSVDRAIDFAKGVDHGEHVCALVKRDGKWRAQLEDGPICEAATPSLAVCLAAVKKLMAHN